MKPIVCLPFCMALFLFCFTTVTSKPSSNCCLKTSNKRIPKNKVVDYTIQRAGLCHINAIVLLTEKRKARCYDPNSAWIKKVTAMVNRRKMQPNQNSDPKGLQRQKNRNTRQKKN
ncbi:C-C motif chemokine 20-like [Myxocyprinus asiaticus]|uniref:C-C motif chemokine 20-like n=1 Tax=Myxocyprinus asiaticus TaxID=70543 RepID=UPI00222328F8|nr:C-C motif chemokine 20-like [Myxocyprinus asiaticus]